MAENTVSSDENVSDLSGTESESDSDDLETPNIHGTTAKVRGSRS